MTENGHRRDMHPAEQIAGFRAMAQEGKTPAQIGDLLGYSPPRSANAETGRPCACHPSMRWQKHHHRHVSWRWRTNDARQGGFAACQSGWGGKPEVQTIRRLVTESEVKWRAGNSKFRFVG